MYLPKKDMAVTGLVAVAGVVYGLWAAGSALPGMSSAGVTGAVVLALGFAACPSAVVPAFDHLLHGNKTYLVLTSLLGLAAAVAGVVMLVTASSAALAVMVAAIGALWLLATIRHSLLARAESAPQQVISRRSMRHGPPRATAA